MTKTLTIELPDNLQERLGLPANSADASLEVVIPLASLIGTLHLGTTDLAENHDRYLTAVSRALGQSSACPPHRPIPVH
jgi:hypothetical protein